MTDEVDRILQGRFKPKMETVCMGYRCADGSVKHAAYCSLQKTAQGMGPVSHGISPECYAETRKMYGMKPKIM